MFDVSPVLCRKLFQTKDELHKRPELSGEERETTRYLTKRLGDLGLKIVELGLGTGVVALLQGGEGPTVCLRADIDALPVEESETHSVRSQVKGCMHACGHDAHMTMLLGAAELLVKNREALVGDVVFLFQPAEETVQGAKAVLKAGLIEKLDIRAMLGLHVQPDWYAGQVAAGSGPVMSAKDSFTAVVCGKSGHGSAPQSTRDPIVAAAAVVSALQTVVSRRIDPKTPAVVSVCSIHGGSTDNIIPDCVELKGGVRSMDEGVEEQIAQLIPQTIHDVAAAYGCDAKTAYERQVPVLVNNAALCGVAVAAAKEALGEDKVLPQPVWMGSEDFAEYTRETPSFFYFLGCREEGAQYYPLHNGGFQVAPETLPCGARLLATAALRVQEELARTTNQNP